RFTLGARLGHNRMSVSNALLDFVQILSTNRGLRIINPSSLRIRHIKSPFFGSRFNILTRQNVVPWQGFYSPGVASAGVPLSRNSITCAYLASALLPLNARPVT